jgi:hypothetical protein
VGVTIKEELQVRNNSEVLVLSKIASLRERHTNSLAKTLST